MTRDLVHVTGDAMPKVRQVSRVSWNSFTGMTSQHPILFQAPFFIKPTVLWRVNQKHKTPILSPRLRSATPIMEHTLWQCIDVTLGRLTEGLGLSKPATFTLTLRRRQAAADAPGSRGVG